MFRIMVFFVFRNQLHTYIDEDKFNEFVFVSIPYIKKNPPSTITCNADFAENYISERSAQNPDTHPHSTKDV